MGKRKKPTSKKKQRCPRIWYREALEAARLVPPKETDAQACWACGKAVIKTMFGYQPKLVEIFDSYGRLVLCMECLGDHLGALATKRGEVKTEAKKEKRRLPTYEEWLAEATIEEMEAVLARHKRRTENDREGYEERFL